MNRHREDIVTLAKGSSQRGMALVIGATGGIGSEFAKALLSRGYHVRALHRRPSDAARDFARLGPIQWVRGDAMNQADVIAAAEGASLIFHGANPPGYQNWKELALPMLESSIAAAKASGARIIFPGTIYNYGPDAFPRLTERSPQNPKTRKGAIRVAMERRLEASAREGVRSLVVRAGDFFGPQAGNNWFGQGLVTGGKPVRSVIYPGPHGIGHAWAYLPDLAETMMRLAEKEEALGDFATFHFRGHYLERGVEMAESIRRVVGKPALPIRSFPWIAAYLGSPFVTLFREMLEMRYLWQVPVELDNSRLLSLLGEEPRTPLDEAVRKALVGVGCMPESAGMVSA